MLTDYTFSKYKDVYQVGNLGSTPLLYSLAQIKDCINYTTIVSGSIPANTPSFVLSNLIFDGVYQLTLTRGNNTAIIAIKEYVALQKALLFNIRQAICGNSKCTNCDEQGLDDCIQYQGLFSQLLAYQYLTQQSLAENCVTGSLVDSYLHRAMDLNSCVISQDIYAQLTSEAMYGKVTNSKELVIYFTALYYVVYYLHERALATDDAEALYVDTKYYWTQVQGCIRALGININDLKDLFTNIINTCSNEAPTVGSISKYFEAAEGQSNYSYTFTQLDFTTNFADVNGDQPGQVKILSNTFIGKLYFNGVLINGEGYIFNISDANKLQYRYTLTEDNVVFDKIFFQISDDNVNPKYSEMATIDIETQAYINQPPNAVGDNTITIGNRVARVFTLADFTTATTPQYHDPEGDGVYQLRIDSLPVQGVLKVSGSPASVGQIIAASLIASGGFEYDAPDQNAASSVSFNFSLSDTGSHTFVS